jgi:hypothetical protein
MSLSPFNSPYPLLILCRYPLLILRGKKSATDDGVAKGDIHRFVTFPAPGFAKGGLLRY